MYDTSNFKKGLKILIDEAPYNIIDFQHVKPGKGNQFTRTKLKNLMTGSNLERTFKSGEKFGIPDILYTDMNFLYKDESGYYFMNQANYEQITLATDIVAEATNYLIDNLQVTICLFNDRAISIELPKTMDLKVTQTDPGFKGNTVSNTYKPATLETGLVVQVPLHTKEGDVLKIDTRNGEYIERVNK